MHNLVRRMSLLAVMLVVGGWNLATVRADSQSYCAAYIHPGDAGPLLTLFPTDGPVATIPLAPGLPRSLRVIGFGPAGTAIYVQNADPSKEEGIKKIQFKPLRKDVVHGSNGLGAIWHLTETPTGRILVSGMFNTARNGGCGTFEIDTDAGTVRTLLIGAYPRCGGGGGAISPDGRRVLGYTAEGLSFVDLPAGRVQAIEGVRSNDLTWGSWSSEVTWSPDGRWITAILDKGRIVLIDATDTSRRRNLGSSAGIPVIWSPDSKHLLLSKSQGSCSAYLYFESLEVIDIESGRRSVIKGSHCEVGPGWLAWLACDVIH